MIGQQVLLYFAILIFIIYATVYFGVRRKQERIRRAALYYLVRFRVPEDTPVRFDVAAVDGEGFRLIRNAFLF